MEEDSRFSYEEINNVTSSVNDTSYKSLNQRRKTRKVRHMTSFMHQLEHGLQHDDPYNQQLSKASSTLTEEHKFSDICDNKMQANNSSQEDILNDTFSPRGFFNGKDGSEQYPHSRSIAEYTSPPSTPAQAPEGERHQEYQQEEVEKEEQDEVMSDGAGNISDPIDMQNVLPYKDNGDVSEEIDNKLEVVINYWQQAVNRSTGNKGQTSQRASACNTLTPFEVEKIWEDVNKSREVQTKQWSVQKELNFIGRHFKQRRCKHYVQKSHTARKLFADCLSQYKIFIKANKEYCCCGLEKECHSSDSGGRSKPNSLTVNRTSSEWTPPTHTERIRTWNFGNVDMPGSYSYLDLPEGTRKYLRLDDLSSHADRVWELLTMYWGLRKPNMVISVTGGDVSELFTNTFLHKQFRDGIIKTAVNTKSWVITEGLHIGSSKEIGDIFQEDLKKSEWSEVEDHANLPLIAIGPWGVVAGQESLAGIHVGTNEAKYNFIALEGDSSVKHNILNPYHTVYLLCDDGTSGRYKKELNVRKKFEKFIKQKTTIEIFATKDVPTPVVILVLGGDAFTLQKIADAVDKSVQISVVIINGSGPIANMLAAVYKMLENICPCKSKKSPYEWTEKEEDLLKKEIARYKDEELLSKKSSTDAANLKIFMTGRHLIRVFGCEDGDQVNLDKAILNAVFGGVTEISAQLNLTLALDRVGIAKEIIFIEARKEELRTEGLVENALYLSLKTAKPDFTQLLLDQDFGGEFNFPKFLSLKRLFQLHIENLNSKGPLAKILKSLTKKDVYGSDELADDNILPQVGRIIYMLMGDNYRLLYQEREFRKIDDKPLPWKLANHSKEEAIWHIFLWAVLSNHKEIAELFLFESDCKIGAALIAHKMYKELAKVAEVWHETELAEDLKKDAEYFESLAIETLDHLYEMNREEAYANLVSVIPFHWGKYATPLSIADDGEAMRFIGHACCQTFLNLLWMKYMDLDTSYWKLFPLFSFFPFINIPLIFFDKKNLSFGSYKDEVVDSSSSSPGDTLIGEGRLRTVSGSESIEAFDAGKYEDNVSDVEGDQKDNKSEADYKTDQTQQVTTERNKKLRRRLAFAWFCVRNYYTSPVMKFLHSFITYVLFLGIFTHFVVSELRPIGPDGLSSVSVYEWLTYIWVGSITCQELAQLVARMSSGPLYNITLYDMVPEWNNTWYLLEQIKFVLRFHKIALFLSDRWNKIDALMILMFTAAVVLRFSLNDVDFDLVRVFFSVTLILFYVRLLRLGYILRSLGPRIITIREMIGDLFQFLLILSVFIISFGVAFQAILNPNKSPSWDLLVDILWRSYWQMYGELLIDDLEGMGREVEGRNCTSYRQLAKDFPEQYQYCYNWMAFLVLAVYMLITNILLLNLLIAIFSNSFEKIETNSQLVWRYHMYDLVHEYYQQVWLPPPLNILCHLANITIWLTRWPRRLLFYAAMQRNKAKVHARYDLSQEVLSQEAKARQNMMINETEQEVAKECCSVFYYDNKDRELQYIDHFRQEEYMRDEDLEEMAYKKYMRSQKKDKNRESKIKDMLKQQSARLQAITADISQVKNEITLDQQSEAKDDVHSISSFRLTRKRTSERIKMSSRDSILQTEVRDLQNKMDNITSRLDTMSTNIAPLLKFVERKMLRKDRKTGISKATGDA